VRRALLPALAARSRVVLGLRGLLALRIDPLAGDAALNAPEEGAMPPTPQQFFQAMFQKHWDAGTGLSAHKTRPRGCWTTSDFVDAMAKAEYGVAL